MKRILIYSLGCILFASCNNEKQFTIEGNITGAEGKTLYLESNGMTQTAVLDSAVLKTKGTFQFHGAAPANPEFYRLRLDGQSINLSIDSTEVVAIQAEAKDMSTRYNIEGSAECEKIRTVTLEGMNLRKLLVSLNESYIKKEIDAQQFSKNLQEVVAAYKSAVTPFIYENPRSATAYFTLLQQVNGLKIFDPFDKTDYRAYGAVATGWDTYYKDCERSRQLVTMTLQALYVQRQQREATQKNDASNQALLESPVAELNFIDVVLPNVYGVKRKLSELKGKVVLLDFTAYAADYSGPYNIALNKVYTKFKDKGFEIFQVSFDTDENFWKTTASNLPWFTVRDQESVYSRYVGLYNVTQLPTAYLLDRQGMIVSRASQTKDIEAAIARLL